MYRETLLGVALANAMEELQPILQLSDEQRKTVWNMFDKSFAQVLAEAPRESRMTVRSQPPRAELSTGDSEPIVVGDDGSTNEGHTPSDPHTEAVVGLTSEETAFPLYRVTDGLWTIVLKDVEIQMEDGTGRRESMPVDFLKCTLKEDPLLQLGGHRKRQRGEQY